MAMNYPTYTGGGPTMGMIGQGGGVPAGQNWWSGNVAPTFLGDPSGAWQAARAAQFTDAQLANPQWTNQMMTGFTPTYGQYLLGGAQNPFSTWMQGNAPAQSYTAGPYNQPATSPGWANAVTASNALAMGGLPGNLTSEQLTMQGLLQGENARQNALAMSAAYMGGGVGMGAQARQRALGNMYDIYGARASSAGEAPGGFLQWLNQRLGGTAVTGAAGTNYGNEVTSGDVI